MLAWSFLICLLEKNAFSYKLSKFNMVSLKYNKKTTVHFIVTFLE